MRCNSLGGLGKMVIGGMGIQEAMDMAVSDCLLEWIRQGAEVMMHEKEGIGLLDSFRPFVSMVSFSPRPY